MAEKYCFKEARKSLLQCQCMAELPVLNDEYTRQRHINWCGSLLLAVNVLNNSTEFNVFD